MEMLSKREREFIKDWISVAEGRMDRLEFYIKWGIRRHGRKFAEDVEALKRGEITAEEFMQRWSRGEWKAYVRVMRYRLKKKLEQSRKDIELLRKFFGLRIMP